VLTPQPHPLEQCRCSLSISFAPVLVLNFVDTLFSQSRFWFPCHGNGAAVSDPDYQPVKSQEVNQDSYKTRVKRYYYGEGFICGRDKKENPA